MKMPEIHLCVPYIVSEWDLSLRLSLTKNRQKNYKENILENEKQLLNISKRLLLLCWQRLCQNAIFSLEKTCDFETLWHFARDFITKL